MKKNNRVWKNKDFECWIKTMNTYFKLKQSPSCKLVLKITFLLIRIVISIIIRKIITYFFENL